jgi:tetratricopeptide (TPR) repeat protein
MNTEDGGAITNADARKFLHTIAMIEPRPDVERAGEIANSLRDARAFDELLEFSDQCIALRFTSPKLLRLNGHALIERGEIDKALSLLTMLKSGLARDHVEYSQATGLLGRAFKQLFLTNKLNKGKAFCQAAMQNAIAHYQEGLELAGDRADCVWHAVNVAALGKRAEKEGMAVQSKIDWRAAARQVVDHVERNPTAWNYASAGEACLALDEPDKAIEWFEKYAQSSDPGQYALHSITRQLRDLWDIKPDHTAVGKILAMLQARLVAVEKGILQISAAEINNVPSLHEQNAGILERVIGRGGFQFYDDFIKGLQRGKAIARIGPTANKGHGTGFLVNGEDFSRRWRGQRLLLTNAHVLSNDRSIIGQELALLPSEAVITFTSCGNDRIFKVAELCWTSPCTELDASLVKLTPAPPDDIGCCEIANALPPRVTALAEKQLVFILGHPGGGDLSISLNNNELIDHEAPDDGRKAPERVRIHYRTPTLPGSSGSPVFFGDKWQVIGIHHMGGSKLLPLSGRGEAYEANEAIWIQSIRAKTMRLSRF